jgi:hypothetical protein
MAYAIATFTTLRRFSSDQNDAMIPPPLRESSGDSNLIEAFHYRDAREKRQKTRGKSVRWVSFSNGRFGSLAAAQIRSDIIT